MSLRQGPRVVRGSLMHSYSFLYVYGFFPYGLRVFYGLQLGLWPLGFRMGLSLLGFFFTEY